MSVYTVVTEHVGGVVKAETFPTWEQARDYSKTIDPDAVGSTIPNISDAVVARYEALGHERQAYAYWLRSNKYAAIFLLGDAAYEEPA